ncbi:ion transporter [Salinibacterium sp. NSLL150]|nr:ion transporter [Salinibacterium sp. NSLL35]MBH0102682.1 ion transporter [Salinibacterium sp. NSLL150]MBH0105442.1 ion transporter [Salinibacterium sp. NSLL16]MBH0108202.1 ion transporter [Salinibacterium sp. NSLL17]
MNNRRVTLTSSPESPSFRHRLAQFVDSAPVQNFVLAVIIVNAVVIALATAAEEGTTTYSVLHALDSIALVVFVIELLLKLVSYGPKRFFTDGWTVFDFIVVAIALVPSSGPLSVLRALRVLRILRVVKFLPQVRMVVEALLRSFPGIGAIALLMSLVFFVASVMSTELFGDAFPEWFGDIGKSTYSLFQIMTLESWSMGIVRPIMEVMPLAWLFFVPFILIAAFITLNLFIAVIVDTMQSLRVEREEAAGAEAEKESPRLALELDDDELALLSTGLARLSATDSAPHEVLQVWGIETSAALKEEAQRLHEALAGDKELSHADWARTLFAADMALIRGLSDGAAEQRAADDQAALALSRSIRARINAHGALTSPAIG